ncbi:unnamed protein product [Alternaria alternata]
MNRKAWRKARKSATKTVGDIVVSDAEDQTAHTEGLSTEPRLFEDTIEYECCICGDDFPFSAGVAHCEEHFTCNSCVVDAEGFHQDAGCPSYGDPDEGYDNEGYELGGRGLHRDTGYNRMGLNRFGQRQLSHAVVEESAASEHDQYSDNENLDYDEYEIDYAGGAQWVNDAQFGDNERVDGIAPEDEIEWGEPAQGGRPWDEELDAEQDEIVINFDNSWHLELAPFTDEANPVEATIVTSWDLAPAPQRNSQTSPPPDSVRQQIRLARRVPILALNPHPENSVFSPGTPSLQQLECRHSWHRHLRLPQTEYGYAHCLGCNYIAGSWTNYCSACGVVACDWCTYQFRGRFVSMWEHATGLLDVLIWAEKGVVPFKTERRHALEQLEDELWADCDEDILGLATMLEVYETQLFELQPYLYWDFGIRLMFEELELQMRKEYCAVTEEDVGISGLTLTFNLATNPFAPLHWDS